MISPTTFVRVCLYGVLLYAVSGCSATKLTDHWQSPTLKRQSMDNVLVVAMASNTTNRILFEEGFVKALTDSGIQSIASHKVVPGELPTRETVTAYVEKNDIHFVIATSYGGSDVTRWVVPEQVRTYYTGPYIPTYGGYWDYYGTTITMTRASYVDESTQVMLLTNIYDIRSGDLVWAGRSKTFEVHSLSYEAADLARLVVDSIND